MAEMESDQPSVLEMLAADPADGLCRRTTKALLRFVEERTRLLSLTVFLSSKPVPFDLNWAYTLGSVSLFLFVNQLVTGVLLALYYRPAVSEAYESVRFIEEEVTFGWLVRQLHAWGANLMILALCLHMARVWWYGSYKKPRELNWLVGFCLFLLTLTFGFTGYLLPWDQLSYWASKVGTEIPGAVPVVGAYILKAMRGGEEITGATLGRFYAIHTLVLPAITVSLVFIHLAMMRLHGITPLPGREDSRKVPFFPHHVLKDAVSIYCTLAIIYFLVVVCPWKLHEKADPLVTPEGVKPEWYFLWTYQYIKYFPQQMGAVSGKVVGILSSGLFFALLALFPFLDRGDERRPAKRKLILGVGFLALAFVLAMTVLGFICETEHTILGTHIKFDILGIPEVVKKP
ncbi:MAG: cytochrome bc complex cytochrome b subunit [Candidatus Wallbacteria bacterium]|nr:cytochrome bc complex cytochrome b subunit [Candidatus Wallbacteria bacterium]